MRKMFTGLCASALAFALTATSLVPVQAAPVYSPPPAAERGTGNVILVQQSDEEILRRLGPAQRKVWLNNRRKKSEARGDRPDSRRDRSEARRDRREVRQEARRDRRRDEARGDREDARRDWRRDDDRGDWDETRSDWRRDRREARRDYRDREGYYRGYRGYREYRPGYRREGDYWYPAAAFLAGAVVGGAISNSQPRVVVQDSSHTEWCYNRYRSYRASDDTFQPYGGPRQQCISPY